MTDACSAGPTPIALVAHAKLLTTSLDLGAGRGELDKDDIAESLLGVVGDADGANLGGLVVGDPLVVLGVAGCGCGDRRLDKVG